jgi:hypothetical protein
MTRFRPSFKLFLVFCFTLALASAAQAQSRTFVSANGDDINPCSRTAPCKTFSGAISKTTEGGEIDALDPGGFGTLTITKAITVDGGTGSGWGSVLASGLAGMTINISAISGTHPNDAVVILRNLTFDGISQTSSSAGTNGINYVRGHRVIVENCQFENFSTSGINMALASSGNMWVKDCVFDNVATGIKVSTTSGFAVANVDNCSFAGMADGINTTTNAFVTIRNSSFAGLTGASNGAARAAGTCTLNILNSLFSNNTIGANVAGGTIRLSNNDFFNNTTAISGTAESANNNRFRGNTADGATSNVIVVK